MRTLKIFIFTILVSIYAYGSGINIKITKFNKTKQIYKIEFNSQYVQTLSTLNYKEANIYIKELLIKAYKKLHLNSYEISKYHIFIKKEDLDNFKKGYLLWIKIVYKAKQLTKIYIEMKK